MASPIFFPFTILNGQICVRFGVYKDICLCPGSWLFLQHHPSKHSPLVQISRQKALKPITQPSSRPPFKTNLQHEVHRRCLCRPRYSGYSQPSPSSSSRLQACYLLLPSQRQWLASVQHCRSVGGKYSLQHRRVEHEKVLTIDSLLAPALPRLSASSTARMAAPTAFPPTSLSHKSINLWQMGIVRWPVGWKTDERRISEFSIQRVCVTCIAWQLNLNIKFMTQIMDTP